MPPSWAVATNPHLGRLRQHCRDPRVDPRLVLTRGGAGPTRPEGGVSPLRATPTKPRPSAGCPLLTATGLSGLVQLQDLEELELTNCPGATPELFKYFSQHLPRCLVVE